MRKRSDDCRLGIGQEGEFTTVREAIKIMTYNDDTISPSRQETE